MQINYNTAKEKGTLLKNERGCELFRIDDGRLHHFLMHSPKTGDHIVTQITSAFEPRISAHWKGFTSNQ